MSKSKKKLQHTYTKEQTVWILEHPHLRRSELAKKFNKKFDADVTPIAIAKRKQRMILEPKGKKNKKEIKRTTFKVRGENISIKEILALVREQGHLIEKMIEKL